MKTLCAFFCFSFLCHSAIARRCPGAPSNDPDPTINQLLKDFTSDQWPRVWAAKLRLESRQTAALPALIELLSSNDYVELQNTWDLIYPGAKEFYGHGFIVDYDLDWLSVRAGWALEEITFQQFGFSSNVIKKQDLFQASLAGTADRPLKDVIKIPEDLRRRQESRRRSVEQAVRWWNDEGKRWRRLDGVIKALQSGDEVRMSRTLEWIFNGETRCEGFDRIRMKNLILPAAGRYAKSQNQLLRDKIARLRSDWQKEWIYKSKDEEACY